MTETVRLTEPQIRAVKLDSQGAIVDDIAESVGVSARTIYRWRELPDYQKLMTALLNDVQHTARNTLLSHAKKASDVLTKLMDSADEGTRMKAALSVLDRTGHPKAERIEMDAKVDATVDTGRPIDALDSMMTGGGGEQ
jgi:hypothetical protein